MSYLEKKETHIQDLLKTSTEMKKEEIALSYKSNLNLVADAKANLDNIRKEPLNLAFLLKDVEILRFKEEEPMIDKINLKSMEIKFL